MKNTNLIKTLIPIFMLACIGCDQQNTNTPAPKMRIVGLCEQRLGDIGYNSPAFDAPHIKHFSAPYVFWNEKNNVIYAVKIERDGVMDIANTQRGLQEISKDVEEDTAYVIKLIGEKYADIGVVKYKPEEKWFDKSLLPALFSYGENKDRDWYVLAEVKEPSVDTRGIVVIEWHDGCYRVSSVIAYDLALKDNEVQRDKDLL